jgi:hypothetical protein
MAMLYGNIHTNQRGCIEPMIDIHNQVEWAKQGIYSAPGGYWAVRCCNTTIGLHAMAWIWMHKRHPAEGMRQGSDSERDISFAWIFSSFSFNFFIICYYSFLI